MELFGMGLTKHRPTHQRLVADLSRRINNSLRTRQTRRLGVLPKSGKESIDVCPGMEKQMKRMESVLPCCEGGNVMLPSHLITDDTLINDL